MSDYFERVEQQLLRSVDARAPRRWRWPGWLAPVAATLVVVAVVAVFLGVRGRSSSIKSAGPARVVFTGPAGSGAAIDRAANILRLRLDAVFHDVQVTRVGDQITVSAGGASPQQIEALAVPGRLAVYDWEANVLTPQGSTVAAQLGTGNTSAITISQGFGAFAPGAAGAGGMSLYDAVLLASKQAHGAGGGARYYLFGVPGSVACGRRPVHCLLAGPAATPSALRPKVPQSVGWLGQHLAVPRGVVVLGAEAAHFGRSPAISNPAALFYVLRDAPAPAGRFVTGPRASEDAGGEPNVVFGFTPGGARAFQRTTATVARRGAALSSAGQVLNQHFAIALDDRLVTVASIDFKTYPNGISGLDGADIEAGFTRQSAREFATLLRYGPLPVNLRPQSR